MTRLRALLRGGLAATEAMWAPVEAAYAWVFRAAVILANAAGLSGAAVKAGYRGLLGAMARHGERAGELAGALKHFGKVTRSYWPGLFHCYDVPDLPRTDNDLEQLFGSHRYHERRASGRKQGSPGLVVQGSVRVVASLATRLRPEEGLKLPTGYGEPWRRLRADLDKRRESRRKQRRFRRDSATYLSQLEDHCLKAILPTSKKSTTANLA